MVDLEAGELLPCIPLSLASDGSEATPSITVVDDEFLILQWSGSSTLGVFIKGTGDPGGRILDYGERVLAVCKSENSQLS